MKNRDKIIDKFIKWCDPHDIDFRMNIYANLVTKHYIESLSDNEFKDFFTKFVSEGGNVQTGGARTINQFETTIEKELISFRSYVLEPFNKEFDLHDWFDHRKRFLGFGVGIATIFLNRIDYKKYSIMNNKTLKSLNKLSTS